MEGVVLGGVGGAAALGFAVLLFPYTVAWLPDDLARAGEVGVSWSGGLLWFTAALLAGGVVGAVGQQMAPSRAELRSGTRTTRKGGAGPALVAGQLALTTLLVGVGALVLERSVQLSRLDVGFEAEGVHSGFVSLPRSTHDGWEARRDSWSAILAALDDAGVVAAISTNPPMSGMNSNYGYGRPGDERQSFGQYSIVSSRYFEVMGIPVLSGRSFASGESGPVTLISEALANEHFTGEDPVGQSLEILGQAHEIIGVVGSTAHFGPEAPEPTAMYVSYEAVNWDFAHLVARGDRTVAPRVVEAVERVAPGATPPRVAPYEDHLSSWFRPLRIQVGIVGALGLVGGLLAGLGLYANIAYQVRGRLVELGVRVALGASRLGIVSGVVRRGLVSAGWGLGAGLLLWWTFHERLGALLGAADGAMSPFALAATSVLILGLSLLAVSVPALRASRADPLESLRAE